MFRQKKFFIITYSVFSLLLLTNCGNNSSINPNENQVIKKEETPTTGKLTLVANGEDFVRQGFITKDGWQIDFQNVYVTVTDAIAYQTDPPFNAKEKMALTPKETIVLLDEPTTINLAEGDENASPISVKQIEAKEGIYNALAWKVINSENESEKPTIILEGKAKKDGQNIDFVINLNPNLNYICGEFIGEERKGIVTSENPAELEITFHFDHIFGDKSTSLDEEINQNALGFEPFARLAKNNIVQVDMSILKEKLTPDNYSKIEKAIASLGHVGEGHCINN